MARRMMALIVCAGLAGCGAAGPPLAPQDPGISISGSVSAGIARDGDMKDPNG